MAAGGSAVSHERIEVLLVEDDEGDSRLVEDELAEALPRAHIVRSRDLNGALAKVDESIDCVLLDLGLPDASGFEAVARLRARMPAIPVVVLTGLDDEAAGAAAVQAGAQDYLVKGSVGGEQLARSIRYAIGRRQAQENERQLLLAEAHAREVERLERGLAPKPLLRDASVWVESCYRAGRTSALLGGDFIDLVHDADGTLHLIVGDVCGRGPDEAAIGVSLRAAWRALALAGQRSQAVLATMQEVLEQERHLPGLFATLCTLEVDPARGSASMIRAGHPCPVLIHGTSVSALPDVSTATGIGLGVSHWPDQKLELPPGWAILLYTDGIIEGRIGDGSQRLGEDGLHRLVGELIAAQPDWRQRPDVLLDSLITAAGELNGDALSDDVAMLLVGVSDEPGDR
jgi:serine phosphatase RsbU (regulator of sigma subunit)